MSDEIRIKNEPVDPEYDRILAEIKPDPDEIPDGFFDDIVNDKGLDDLINNDNDQLEDTKPIIPPVEVARSADASSDTDSYVDMELCRERIKELKQLLKCRKKKKRKHHSSNYDKSPSRKKRRSTSRHSRDKSRSRKRSRSSSDGGHRHRKKCYSTEREDIEPPRVRKIKEEQTEENVTVDNAAEENFEETEETRRERVINMCVTFINTFVKPRERPIKTRFFYTPSVIQVSDDGHLLEYRSPLNHITNVQHKFNSLSAYVDIQQFGLRTFTDPVTNVCKEIGFDVPQLMDKLTMNELPQALKPEKTSDTLFKDGKFHTPFFTDAATQTEELSCISCVQRKLKTFAERGVMAIPMRAYKGVQTESEEDLPIMNTISLLNSSQLQALKDFSEIIRAPAPTYPNDIFRLREKLMEIFNVSQQSCVMTANVTPTGSAQLSTAQQRRYNTPMQTQSQTQYNINNPANSSHISQPNYSGLIGHPQNPTQFFNMNPQMQQNQTFPTQLAHTSMNAQYQYQLQDEQNQHHYPQHSMSMSSQYHTPQPVAPPNVRREDPRHRGKDINTNNGSAPPRANDVAKAPSLGREPRNFKSRRK